MKPEPPGSKSELIITSKMKEIALEVGFHNVSLTVEVICCGAIEVS